ncbi:unnamed protein product [Cochlearia groenlandica]
MEKNFAASPEYAAAKIAVWWDMRDCPIPEGYYARRVRSSIEESFRQLSYSGPVSITAYADHKQTPHHILRGLSSTGVNIVQTLSEAICGRMYSDILEWRANNPPPATMMLVSSQVFEVFTLDLVRLQQHTMYNLCLAHKSIPCYTSVLITGAQWHWEALLQTTVSSTTEKIQEEVSSSMFFYCKTCGFRYQSLRDFKKHISGKSHAVQEVWQPTYKELDPVTRTWVKNYFAKPEYATANIGVLWDMRDCPIPEGYDACRVRSSMEESFRKLGYTGPVSITAYADHTQTPDHILQVLSSTGIDVAHTSNDCRYTRMSKDWSEWQIENPPPATLMLISDRLEYFFARRLVSNQQMEKYNVFTAHSYRPEKTSILVTSAEWLWESLLGGFHSSSSSMKLTNFFLVVFMRIALFFFHTVSKTRRHVFRKCSERGESIGMYNCKVCYWDCQSLDDFRKHLSSKEHELNVNIHPLYQ